MSNYAMAIDLNRCIGCYNCQIACKDEHVGNDFAPIAQSQPTFGHFWLSIAEKEQVWSPSHIKVTYIPKPCQQCDSPACAKAAKDGAVYRREDGIVIIDPEKAQGQKGLVDSCPYGSIYLNEEKGLPQKCTFCAHLMDDQWASPRCVQSCPTSCMHFGDLDDPESAVSKFLAENETEALSPEFGTVPRVFYAGLPKPHLSGTLRCAEKGECVKNVGVTLVRPDGAKLETVTDCFGDFQYKNTPPGKYLLSLEAKGYKGESRQLEISQAITFLGEIALEQA